MKVYINQGQDSNLIQEFGQFDNIEQATDYLQKGMGEITLIWTTFNNDEPITNIKKFRLTEIPPSRNITLGEHNAIMNLVNKVEKLSR